MISIVEHKSVKQHRKVMNVAHELNRQMRCKMVYYTIDEKGNQSVHETLEEAKDYAFGKSGADKIKVFVNDGKKDIIRYDNGDKTDLQG